MMNDHLILQPVQKEDLEEISELLECVIIDNFKKDGIFSEKHDLMIDEIHHQIDKLNQSLLEHSLNHFYKLKNDHQIIAVLAYGPAEHLITNHIDFEKSCLEIKSFMILPEFQKQGYGRMMFEQILEILHKNRETSFCLDCGYRSSQEFWKKILGDPTVQLYDFWGHGYDHLIWVRKIAQFIT